MHFGNWKRAISNALAWLAVALVGVSICAQLNAAVASSRQCRGLRAQINALSHGGSGGRKYAVAAQREGAKLSRLQNYANSAGCNNRKFLIFGQDPPRQCQGIEAQISRSQGRLGQLQAAMGRSQDGSAQLAHLQARYDDQCGRIVPQVREAVSQPPHNFFDAIFGRGQAQYNEPATVYDGRGQVIQAPQQRSRQRKFDEPSDRQSDVIDLSDSSPRSHGGATALCVRTCDGGFFPVSYSARSQNYASLQDLCTAQCPNAEVKLYTYRNGADVGTAVSTDGDSYKDLTAAFQYRTKLDATCTCKRANQTWVQALANAEEVLGNQEKGDIIVSKKQSDQMALPVLIKADRRKSGQRRAFQRNEVQPRDIQNSKARARKMAGKETGAQFEGSTQFPATNPAGLQKVDASDPPVRFRTVRGPDGVKRKVRIIAPAQ